MIQIAKLFIIFGVISVIAGLLILFGLRIPFLGKLPGDIYVKKENFTLYFPLATSLIASVALSLIFWIFRSK